MKSEKTKILRYGDVGGHPNQVISLHIKQEN